MSQDIARIARMIVSIVASSGSLGSFDVRLKSDLRSICDAWPKICAIAGFFGRFPGYHPFCETWESISAVCLTLFFSLLKSNWTRRGNSSTRIAASPVIWRSVSFDKVFSAFPHRSVNTYPIRNSPSDAAPVTDAAAQHNRNCGHQQEFSWLPVKVKVT